MSLNTLIQGNTVSTVMPPKDGKLLVLSSDKTNVSVVEDGQVTQGGLSVIQYASAFVNQDGTYLLFRTDGIVAKSDDLSTATPIDERHNLTGVAFFENAFYASMGGRDLLKSTDGETWTTLLTGSPTDIVSVKVIGDKLVLFSSLGAFAYLTGDVFTQMGVSLNDTHAYAEANSTLYYADSSDFSPNHNVFSVDDMASGSTTIHSVSGARGVMHHIVSNDSIMVGMNASNLFCYSTDGGKSWTTTATSGGFSPIRVCNNVFFYFDSQSKYSTDGITWNDSVGSSSITTVFYAGNIFFGTDGFNSYYSLDNGANWVNNNSIGAYKSVVYLNETYVCYVAAGLIYYSVDGITWNMALSHGGSSITGILIKDDKFIATTASASWYWSENGSDWYGLIGQSPDDADGMLPAMQVHDRYIALHDYLTSLSFSTIGMVYIDANTPYWRPFVFLDGSYYSSNVDASITYGDGFYYLGYLRKVYRSRDCITWETCYNGTDTVVGAMGGKCESIAYHNKSLIVTFELDGNYLHLISRNKGVTFTHGCDDNAGVFAFVEDDTNVYALLKNNAIWTLPKGQSTGTQILTDAFFKLAVYFITAHVFGSKLLMVNETGTVAVCSDIGTFDTVMQVKLALNGKVIGAEVYQDTFYVFARDWDARIHMAATKDGINWKVKPLNIAMTTNATLGIAHGNDDVSVITLGNSLYLSKKYASFGEYMTKHMASVFK